MAAENALRASGARDCRGCAACCTRLPIPAGEVGPDSKPPGVTCPRLSASGCEIYVRRPKLCVDFRCAWLADESWPDRWRPDRSGLMCLREEIEEGLTAAAIYEIRPGALGEPTAATIIEEIKRTTAVIAIIDYRQRRERLLGRLGVHAAEPPVRKPHFLGRRQEDFSPHTAASPNETPEPARTRSR